MDLKVDKALTAEEKLLRVIKKSPKQDSKVDISPTTRKSSLSSKGGSRDPLSLLQKVLFIVFLAMISFIGYRYLTEPMDSVVEDDSIKTPSPKDAKAVSTIESPKPFEDYEQQLKDRNLFLFPWEKPVSKEKTEDATAVPIVSLSSQMQIKGILLDQDPKVVLQDLIKDETVILSIGESLNGAAVKEIHEDKVIFTYNNQTVELLP